MKAKKYTSDLDINIFTKVVEYICGHSIENDVLIDMMAVWKAINRQHIIFRNLYGSDEKFMNLIIKIIIGLGSK